MISHKNYYLIKPNINQKNQIAELIEKVNGSIFHDVTFNEIISNNFNTELFYFVDNINEISSFAPVHRTKSMLGLNQYSFKPVNDIPYSGFVGEDYGVLHNLSKGFFDSIIYAGLPIDNEIINISKKELYGETAMVDLRMEEEDIFKNIIHSKRRNMIRKAISEGITIKCFTDSTGLDEFWPMVEGLHDRLGYSKLTYGYYNEVIREYGIKNKAFILIAYKDNIAISGVLIVGNRNYMHYYKGATLNAVGSQGQGELLQWEAIKLSKSLGSRYYDLCNINKNKLPAIYKFKTGISNNIYKYPIYSDFSLGSKLINKIKKFNL